MIAKDISADTRCIADLLIAVPRGEVITLDAISDTLGRDVRSVRYVLYNAIRVAERENGAVFASERGKGYRRLPPEEIIRIGQTARSRIRRTARRGSRSMAAGSAGANDLSPEVSRQILAEQSALGLLEHIARDKSLPTISETDRRPLPVALAAKEFMRIIGVKDA